MVSGLELGWLVLKIVFAMSMLYYVVQQDICVILLYFVWMAPLDVILAPWYRHLAENRTRVSNLLVEYYNMIVRHHNGGAEMCVPRTCFMVSPCYTHTFNQMCGCEMTLHWTHDECATDSKYKRFDNILDDTLSPTCASNHVQNDIQIPYGVHRAKIVLCANRLA